MRTKLFYIQELGIIFKLLLLLLLLLLLF